MNSYLLYEKEYTFPYLRKNWFITIGFFYFGAWSLVLLMCVEDYKIAMMEVISGVFVGKGSPFHLWFIVTLMIIHIVYWFVGAALWFLHIEINRIMHWQLLGIFAALMNIIFLFDIIYLMPEKSLVAIIPILYRFIRYWKYFVLRLSIKKVEENWKNLPNLM